MMRGMLTESDILESIKWRLHGVPEQIVETGLQSAFDLIGTLTLIREEDKPVADVLGRLSVPSDRRRPWGLLCALIAVAAHKRRNRPRFWSAGHEVRQAYLQAHRSPRNGRDKLSELIVKRLATHPEVSPSALFDELSSQAAYGIDSTVLGYDCAQDLLAINSDGKGKLKDISRSAFTRRVQRIRKAMARHHPESVASPVESEADEIIAGVGGNGAVEVSSGSCTYDADTPRYRGRAVVEIPDVELMPLSTSPFVPMSIRRAMVEEVQLRQQVITNDDDPAAEMPTLEIDSNGFARDEAKSEVVERGGNATAPVAMSTEDEEVQFQRETVSILERNANED